MSVRVHGKKYKVMVSELNLSDKAITSIKEIEGLNLLVDLWVLNLANNKITTIEGLDKLINLHSLYLNGNQITRIEGLDPLVNLETLDLNANHILQIEGLDQLVNLTTLELENNQITNIKGLDQLIRLKSLNLYSNQITKMEGLGHLQNLEELRLGYNQIANIEGLNQLAHLQSLFLQENEIARIGEMERLEKLRELELQKNPIWSKIDPDEEIDPDDAESQALRIKDYCERVRRKELETRERNRLKEQESRKHRLEDCQKFVKEGNYGEAWAILSKLKSGDFLPQKDLAKLCDELHSATQAELGKTITKIHQLLDGVQSSYIANKFDEARALLKDAEEIYIAAHLFATEDTAYIIDFDSWNSRIIVAEKNFKVLTVVMFFAKKFNRVHINELAEKAGLPVDEVLPILQELIVNHQFPARYDAESKGVEFNLLVDELDKLLKSFEDWNREGQTKKV